MTALSTATLPALTRLAVPNYDRRSLRAGIVHLGVGGFHRAHQAMYLDRLMNQGLAYDWAICGVGVLEADRRMHEVLRSQDFLYSLVTKAADGTWDARVIGSIIEHLLVPDDPDAVIEKMADPAIKIVSLTITEGGYDTRNPTFGLIIEALSRRKQRGVPPFTVMSCDNIPGNGDVARRAVVAAASSSAGSSSAASSSAGDLPAWIDQSVAFPNSMVDRITPVTTDQDRAELARRFGVDDQWPVVCEPFTQWVVEDRFGLGRPPWVGVQLVDDVEPYELMKLRLLNAGHQAIGYFGYLAGYRFAHEAAQDPVFARFLLGYMIEEAIPTLPPVAGVDLDAYARELVARFANPAIRDTLARLCAFSSDRIPKFLLPVVRAQLAAGGPVERSAAVVASWARYAEGVDEAGQRIEVVDALAEQVTAAARSSDDLAFLRQADLFGDLADNERFVASYRRTLASLHERGARLTLGEDLAELDGHRRV